MANVPGDQKLAPLSSADDERWPECVAKAITETRTSNLGRRLAEGATGGHPSLSRARLLWTIYAD